MAHGHSIDDYLETIYFLAFPIGEYRPAVTGSPTLSARVAEMLGVSRASAGEMLKRLEAEGLVERGEHKEAILTAARTRARRAGRPQAPHHRALLTDFMGYTAAESHVHADELGDTFTDDMIERIDERLGHPDRCPHGWPSTPTSSRPRTASSQPLAELEPGDAGDDRPARRARRRAPALVLRPGPRARRRSSRSRQAGRGQFSVRLDGGERAIGEKAAAGLFVAAGVIVSSRDGERAPAEGCRPRQDVTRCRDRGSTHRSSPTRSMRARFTSARVLLVQTGRDSASGGGPSALRWIRAHRRPTAGRLSARTCRELRRQSAPAARGRAIAHCGRRRDAGDTV